VVDTFAKALDMVRPGACVGTTGDAKIRMFSVFWKQLDVHGTTANNSERSSLKFPKPHLSSRAESRDRLNPAR